MKVKCVLQRCVSDKVAGFKAARTHRTLQIPQATVHSSLVAEAWFAWHSMPKELRVSERRTFCYRSGVVLTEIHDVIPANGTVVDHNVPCPERDSIPLEYCQKKPSN